MPAFTKKSPCGGEQKSREKSRARTQLSRPPQGIAAVRYKLCVADEGHAEGAAAGGRAGRGGSWRSEDASSTKGTCAGRESKGYILLAQSYLYLHHACVDRTTEEEKNSTHSVVVVTVVLLVTCRSATYHSGIALTACRDR